MGNFEMVAVTFDQVMRLAEQLSPNEQLALAQRLLTMAIASPTDSITLQAIQAEHGRRLAAGDFENVESLRNKYAKPDSDLSDEELRAGIREFATEWEQEFDEFDGGD
jgi:hypothetical protein